MNVSCFLLYGVYSAVMPSSTVMRITLLRLFHLHDVQLAAVQPYTNTLNE
jgi:hypothetical protein